MVIERASQPDPSQRAALTDADRTRIIIRFALIESVGMIAFLIFLFGFFAADWFPGQPMPLLVGAFVAIALYMLFAMWASGLLAMITDKTNAGR